MFGKSIILLILLSLPATAGAGEDSFRALLAGLKSGNPERRRASLESLLENPARVPEEKWGRVVKALRSILQKDRDPELRGFAAQGLAIRRSTETDAEILHRLVEETHWRAQRMMLDALEGFDDAALLALIEKRVFREPRPDKRGLYTEALGLAAKGSGLPTLLKIAGGAVPWQVAQSAAIALRRHADPLAVDRLIDLLWSDEDGISAAAHHSLVALTGNRDLGPEAGAWVEWWSKNRKGFIFGKKKPAAVGDEVRTVPSTPASVPTYYDIPIRGRRVIFCLDISASMWGPQFEAAQKELARAIRTLPTNYLFGVIFFNEHPLPWRENLLPGYPYQMSEAIAVFTDLETKKFTNIFDTLERALGFAGIGRFAKPDPPGVDDVFILTDGEPNRGKFRDQRAILKGLADLDPTRKVRIHAISIGDAPRDLMKAIAAQQGGRHVHIDAPR